MDLLADLLDHEGAHAREKVRGLLRPDGAAIREASFNIFDVRADHGQQQLAVRDVLDASREPQVISFAEALRRLG